MVYWVSLKPGWKLQDVQAGLNVVIAMICAGGIFVLVRYCWLLAAKRVSKEQDVPVSSLLSLNTIGETIDIIWLLRKDLLKRRYHGLLLQCICVMLLTIAALLSGFIARFSTRYGTIVLERTTNGSIAERKTGSIPYAEVDTNATLASLKNAKFPQNQLLEYMPDFKADWEYVPEQWNSSWHLDCAYEGPTEVPNVSTTGNCTNLQYEVPQIGDNWLDWSVNATWYWDFTGWRNNYTTYRDILIFSHGIEYDDSDDTLNTWTSARIRTVALHLQGVPYNTSLPDNCNFATGKVTYASYTSMTCKMTRDIAGRTADDLYWGAYPDGYDLGIQVTAYLQHYGNNFRRESSREQTVTTITGQDMAMFYQAYMATKDTSTAPFTERKLSVNVRVAQISLATLIVCAIALGFILFGLFHYWLFLFRHWSLMNKTPQSKLDWMLRTLRLDGEDPNQHNVASMRRRLKQAMASGKHKRDVSGDTVPLTNMNAKGATSDVHRVSVASSTVTFPTPEVEQHVYGGGGDDGFETPILGANFSGAAPGVPWFPQAQVQQQQYQSVAGGGGGGGFSQGRQSSFGFGLDYGRGPNNDYNPVYGRYEDRRNTRSRPPVGTHHIDTAYDPGRW